MQRFQVFFPKSSKEAENDVRNGIIYEFSEFRLIPDDGLLLRDDEPVPLPPKAYETLVLLIQHHGHLVKKAQLMEKVWSDAFVEEAVVSKCVWTIRNALGEGSKSQRFIQTVPKRGYKFVGDVIERREAYPIPLEMNENGNGAWDVRDEPDASAVAHAPASPVMARKLPLYIGLSVAAIVGISILYMISLAPAAVATGAPSSLAILPLQPVDSQSRSEIHEMGVAEALIHRLSSSKGLIVRPLSSVRNYAATYQDPVAAGRQLKVDYVLTSNYQLADGKIRITALLIDVPSGGVQETFKVETAEEDIFPLQDAVADEIAKRLIARFNRTPASHFATRGTTNEEAYRLYLQGKALAMKRNPVDAEKARGYLDQAIRLDPNFALAYAQLARVTQKASDTPGESSRTIELIEKALQLDPNLAEAYVARAEKTLTLDWNFPAVEKDLKKALELEPNNDQAHWLSALLSLNRGRFDEAMASIEIARSIDPGAVMYMFHRGRILYYARRYDEAITQYQQASELDDRFMHPFNWRARVHEVLGDHAAAYEFFIKGEERSPRKDRIDLYRKLYETQGWLGVRRDAGEAGRMTVSFDLARLYALLGDEDAAFECLNKAVEKREWLVLTLQVEPAFDNLRDDPRFAELLARVAFERA